MWTQFLNILRAECVCVCVYATLSVKFHICVKSSAISFNVEQESTANFWVFHGFSHTLYFTRESLQILLDIYDLYGDYAVSRRTMRN